MRNATILVMGLKGVATEAIKNIVLAGIGKLIMVDDEDVSEEDLGAGFFFRDEDVGSKVGFIVLYSYSSSLRVRLVCACEVCCAHKDLEADSTVLAHASHSASRAHPSVWILCARVTQSLNRRRPTWDSSV